MSDSAPSSPPYPSLVQLLRHAVVDVKCNHDIDMASSPPASSFASSSSLSSPISTSSSALNLASSPIDALPPELLIIIFYFCILHEPDAPLVLAHVCSYWRAIVTSIPSLWRRLYLTDTHFDAMRLCAKTDLWFAQAGSQTVDVDLDTRRRDSVLPLLSYILAQQPRRWGRVAYHQSRLRFLTAKQQQRKQQKHIDGRTNSNLETLLITLTQKRKTPTDLPPAVPSPPSSVPSSPTQAPWEGTRAVPCVMDFQADNEYLRQIIVLGVRSLPPVEHLRAFPVKTLLLMNSSAECDFPMHQVVPFLAAFPNLEELEMSNCNELFMILDPEFRPDCISISPATLPHLRRLQIRGMYSSRCMLSHLIAPALEQLQLVHINSSNVYDFSIPGEPGDSDDEAHDFSRSPWTDHATGMGLRKLLSQSSSPCASSPTSDCASSSISLSTTATLTPPPIRELTMDYADLRTKDFLWLFAHMPYLEVFRIVASDLSDNVIRALEVSPRALRTGTSGRAVPPLLPRLRRLRLEKCQKMSGEAVCRMVRSRVMAAATKAAGPGAEQEDGSGGGGEGEGGLVAPLEEFAVTECARVSELHHQELQAICPPSCRLVYTPGAEDE